MVRTTPSPRKAPCFNSGIWKMSPFFRGLPESRKKTTTSHLAHTVRWRERKMGVPTTLNRAAGWWNCRRVKLIRSTVPPTRQDPMRPRTCPPPIAVSHVASFAAAFRARNCLLGSQEYHQLNGGRQRASFGRDTCRDVEQK